MPDWIETVLSVVSGGAVVIITQWLADSRLHRRERARRAEDRADRIAMRQSDFQRETLLGLQVAAQKMMRNTGATFHRWSVALRGGTPWGAGRLPENLEEEGLRWRTETMLLASRVRNADVRNLADLLREHCTAFDLSKTEPQGEAAMAAAGRTHEMLIQRIGQLIREIDDVDQSSAS